jgi:hypothetical protein
MTIPALYKGEAKIRRVSYSSTQGASVVFELPDMDAFNQYLGTEGKRVMLVAVLVGDDEQPVPPQRKASEPRKRSARAFLMTQDPTFQHWVETQVRDGRISQQAADEYIKQECGIESKSELDRNEDAAHTFEDVCCVFNHWLESRR